jgi:uncharacterized protein YwgA
MDLRDFVALTLLAAGGEVQGKTKLQKLVYFMGVLTDQLDELGYRAHFYGPYSDEVAYAVGQLRAIGAVDQNETDWGYDRRGFEVKRYDYRLNPAGRRYAEGLKRHNRELWDQIQHAIEVYNRSGDLDYMALSVAAKTYFLLGQRKGKSSMHELAGLAPRFGWSVSPEQIKGAAEYLARLGLVELVNN